MARAMTVAPVSKQLIHTVLNNFNIGSALWECPLQLHYGENQPKWVVCHSNTLAEPNALLSGLNSAALSTRESILYALIVKRTGTW